MMRPATVGPPAPRLTRRSQISLWCGLFSIGMSNAIAAAQHARWLSDLQRVLILIVLILASLRPKAAYIVILDKIKDAKS